MLVQASERRSSFGNPSRVTVRISSMPSRIEPETPDQSRSRRWARLDPGAPLRIHSACAAALKLEARSDQARCLRVPPAAALTALSRLGAGTAPCCLAHLTRLDAHSDDAGGQPAGRQQCYCP